MQKHWRIIILYLGLTLLLAYPLSLRPAGNLLSDDPDGHFFLWTLGWNAHAFLNQPLSIFDANIYHPQSRTLAYSENLIGSALIAAPVIWLTGNPVLALNVVALLSCFLCAVGAYVLARRLGVGQAGAILCGLIFAFSPARFFRISQPHVGAVQWIPFALAFLHSYLDTGRRRDLRLAAGFFTLQALTSGHGAVFATISVVGLFAYRAALGEVLAPFRRVRDLGVTGVLLLVPAALIFLPYREVQVELGLRRQLHDWMPSLESFLASPTHLHSFLLSLLPGIHVNETAHAFLFPGFVPILLAAAAIALRASKSASTAGPPPRAGTLWKRGILVIEIALLCSFAVAAYVTAFEPIRFRLADTLLFSARDAQRAWLTFAVILGVRLALARPVPIEVVPRFRLLRDRFRRWSDRHRRDAATFYGLLTLVSFMLPVLLWPLVYWVPGFNFVRAPSRFVVLGVLGLAVLAGIGFDRLRLRFPPELRARLAVAAGILLIVECAAIPLQVVPFRVEAPAVDRWLALQPKPFVVAEVPVGTAARYQTTYMLHSMSHWQKTVHGYSGVQPALHDRLYDQLRGFPDEAGLRSLSGLGVNYVVVHIDFYQPGQWEDVEERLKQHHDWLKLEHEEGAARVYSLRRREGSGG
jgi:hypothetical protein